MRAAEEHVDRACIDDAAEVLVGHANGQVCEAIVVEVGRRQRWGKRMLDAGQQCDRS